MNLYPFFEMCVPFLIRFNGSPFLLLVSVMIYTEPVGMMLHTATRD